MKHILNHELVQHCVQWWNRQDYKMLRRPLPFLVLLHRTGEDRGVIVSEDGHAVFVRQSGTRILLLAYRIQSSGPAGVAPLRFETVKLRTRVVLRRWIESGDRDLFRQGFRRFFIDYHRKLLKLEQVNPFGSHADPERTDIDNLLTVLSIVRQSGGSAAVYDTYFGHGYVGVFTPGGTLLSGVSLRNDDIELHVEEPSTYGARLLYQAALTMEMNHDE